MSERLDESNPSQIVFKGQLLCYSYIVDIERVFENNLVKYPHKLLLIKRGRKKKTSTNPNS